MIIPTITWLLILSHFAISDSGRIQLQEFKLYPELQIVQTEESKTEHCLQLLGVHLLTVSLITVWVRLVAPGTEERMLKLYTVVLETVGAAILRYPVTESIDTKEG